MSVERNNDFMSTPKPGFFLAGSILLALSGFLSGGGIALNVLAGADGGANIGAGFLIFAGLPVAFVGLVLLLVDLAFYMGSRISERRASR